MKTCSRCEKQRVVPINLDDNMDVCGHTFTASLAAEKCEACGQIAIQGHEVKLFELRIAVELAKAGPRTGECFKYLRKSLGLEHDQLAQLLDVSADVIGYW